MSTRLSHRDYDACSRTMLELYAKTSPQEFPDKLLALLAKLVPVTHVTWNDLNEAQRHYFILYYPERPDLKVLLPQFTATFHTSPLFPHYKAGETMPKKISDVMSVRQFRETAAFQEYYRHAGTNHQMIFTMYNGDQMRVALAFNRDRRDFSERDRAVLIFLSPHLAQAYRNCRVAAKTDLDLETIGEGLDSIHRALMVAEPNGKIHWTSPLAGEWLMEFFPDFTHGAERLPSLLAKWLRNIDRAAQTGRPAFSQLQLPTSSGCRLLVYSGKANGRYVIVLMRERTEIDPVSAEPFGLTPREAEILFWLSEAKTRPEIGAILGVSWRTVAKHMEHIFAKLGVENRMEAQRLGLELRKS
jgi:DNA-binding CsgD family transcriptional regulator